MHQAYIFLQLQMKFFLQKQPLLKFQFKSLFLCSVVSVKGHFRRIRGHFGYVSVRILYNYCQYK